MIDWTLLLHVSAGVIIAPMVFVTVVVLGAILGSLLIYLCMLLFSILSWPFTRRKDETRHSRRAR